MMKKIIKTFLVKYGWFEYFKYTKLYQLYVRLRNPENHEFHLKEEAFYGSFLKHSKLVFDIGANHGNKTAVFLKFSEQVILLEPEINCLDILKFRYAKNRKAVIVPKAVSNNTDKQTFYIQESGSGYNTLSHKWKDVLENDSRWGKFKFQGSYEVETTTLTELIKLYGTPDYIKIDVEGHEKEVVLNLSKAVPLLSIECNLPEFLSETMDILEHLVRLDSNYVFNYSQNDFGKFEFPEFVSYSEFKKIFLNDSIRYMEVYCKNKVNS